MVGERKEIGREEIHGRLHEGSQKVPLDGIARRIASKCCGFDQVHIEAHGLPRDRTLRTDRWVRFNRTLYHQSSALNVLFSYQLEVIDTKYSKEFEITDEMEARAEPGTLKYKDFEDLVGTTVEIVDAMQKVGQRLEFTVKVFGGIPELDNNTSILFFSQGHCER